MTVCGWCDDTMETGPAGAVDAPVSHGLCRSCLDEKLAALPAPAARVARPALGPVASLGRLAGLAPTAPVPVPA